MHSQQEHRGRRGRGALVFVAGGLALLFVLNNVAGVWAESGRLRATVPTPTPRVTATRPAAATATRAPNQPPPPPPPTRIVPPTRTPCLDCPAPVVAADVRDFDLRVNIGGDEYLDGKGHVWEADQEYVPGLSLWGYILGEAESSTFRGKQGIAGTVDPALYQTERWGMAGYRFEAPSGRYRVTLGVAEQFVKAAGKRTFAVKLQGQLVLDQFDPLVEAGGPFTAIDRVFTVTVSNGLLAIDFVPQAENPTIALIAISAILPPTPTPPPSTATPTAEHTPTPTPTQTTARTEPVTPSPLPSPTVTTTPSSTATSLPTTARAVGIFPQAPAVLRSADGSVLVYIPSGVVRGPAMLTHAPAVPADTPPANAGFGIGSQVFWLQAVTAQGQPISTTLLDVMTMTVRYTTDDLEQAARQPERLVLAQYSGELQQWLALDTWPDAARGTVSARTRRSGLFALLVRLPAGAAAAPAGALSWPSAFVFLGGIAVLVVAGNRIAHIGARRPAPPDPDVQ